MLQNQKGHSRTTLAGRRLGKTFLSIVELLRMAFRKDGDVVNIGPSTARGRIQICGVENVRPAV